MAGCLKSSWGRDVGIGEVCFLCIGVAGALDVPWCRRLKNKLKCITTCLFFSAISLGLRQDMRVVETRRVRSLPVGTQWTYIAVRKWASTHAGRVGGGPCCL